MTVPRQAAARPRRWWWTAVVAAAAGVAGLLTALCTPLGPTSTSEALAVMLTGVLLGIAGGRVTRSSWVVVLLGVVYASGMEAGRWGLELPTVGAPRWDSVYGVLAFLVGRGLHALLLLLPMVFGARLAAAPPGATRSRVHRRITDGLVGLLAVVLLGAVLWPASTPPVTGPDGAPAPTGTASLETVVLGGDEHALMLRAVSTDRPVLLYLSGGPGQSDLALSRVLSAPWTDDVVFATYDQRGNGKSYPALVPTAEATLERAVTDTIELSEQLRARFGQDRILLMGESWGTIVGVLAVQRRPDLYRAWIGSGQMVDIRETDSRIYRDLGSEAARTGDTALAETLRGIGEPPYRDLPWANATVMVLYGRLYEPYTPSPGYLARGEASGLDPFGVLGSEYTLMEKANVLRGLIDTFTVVYPQLQQLDLRRDVPALGVPVYVLDGAAELAGRRDLMLEWFARLDAPAKRLVTYEDAAHAVAYEQADAVDQLLRDEVLGDAR